MKAVASFPALSAPQEPQLWHWPMGVWPPTWFLKVLLDLSLLNPLLVQILDELVTLHPVDERTDVSAVSEEGAARQVDGTSCGGQRGRMCDVCCFNIWWEWGGIKDKVRMLTEMLMDIWKVEHYHYSICYLLAQRWLWNSNDTSSSHEVPISRQSWVLCIHQDILIHQGSRKILSCVERWKTHLGHSSFISFTWVDQAALIHTSQVGWCKFIK